MKVDAMVWAYQQQVLPLATKAVLVALAFAMGEDGCFPGQAHLAKLIGGGERTVRRGLADLEARGLIARERRSRANGSRTSDGYTLNTNLPAAAAGKGGDNRPHSPNLPAAAAAPEVQEEVQEREQESETRASARLAPPARPQATQGEGSSLRGAALDLDGPVPQEYGHAGLEGSSAAAAAAGSRSPTPAIRS